ncbi:hemicentin-1-like isoform X1 [Penaeus monodon]|uniref:hemicentin-1-like isoform X1 n=1 Tax=Penaeus monodon TaxID=6687 RepID=UPI0018A7B1BF|nr:hemicentin-1-like isoform X1 [Penaeus monodon]
MKLVLVAVAALLAGGAAVDPLNIVGQLTVSELTQVINDIMEEVLTRVVTRTLPSVQKQSVQNDGVALHPNCSDNNVYNGCDLVVQYKLCNKATYYARYCCRSCTLANQIPLYGEHLLNNAEAPVEAKVTTTSTSVQLGSEVTISCHTSGYPEPDVAWFKGNNLIRLSNKYSLGVSAALNPLVQRPRSDLTIKDFEREDADTYICVAVNQAGRNISSIDLRAEAPIQARITSRDQLYPAGVDVTLQCQAKGYQTPGIIWYKNFEAIVESEKYLRKENGSVDRLLTTVVDTLTIKNADESDSGSYICNATNEAGSDTSQIRVKVTDVIIHPNCTDVIDHDDCVRYLSTECSVTDYIARFCCRTCTLVEHLPAHGPHLLNTAKAPLSADLRLSGSDSVWKFPWGSNIDISCTSGSLLKPTVLWFKDGHVIEESEKYRIQVSEEKVWVRHFVKSQLTVKTLKVGDNGRYTCRAVILGTTEERHATLVFEQDGFFSFRERIQ